MLQTYVDAWRDSVHATIELLDGLDDEAWRTPTDLPGWTVGDVAAHLAHLEAVICGHAEDAGPQVESTTLASDYTEAGVQERRGRPRTEVVEELRAAVAARCDQLATVPEDPKARADRPPAGAPWNWETMLRNRCVDAWCHEQDIRRAIDVPGGLDTAGAVVTTHSLAFAMPFVLGKKVGAPAGTAVCWILTGGVPMEIGATVGDDGRAHGGVPENPTTTLRMTAETFTVLAAGRRGPGAVEIAVDGDADLAHRVLEQMAVTF